MIRGMWASPRIFYLLENYTLMGTPMGRPLGCTLLSSWLRFPSPTKSWKYESYGSILYEVILYAAEVSNHAQMRFINICP